MSNNLLRVKKEGKYNGKYLNCAVCDKTFYVCPSRLRKNKVHTCSIACISKHNSIKYSTKEKYSCEVCGVDVFYKKGRSKKVKFKTCSLSCAGKAKSIYNKGSSNPNSLGLSFFEKYFWHRCVSIKRRCDASKILFDLDYKYLLDLYNQQKGKCHYSGIIMNISGKAQKNGGAEPTAMSVDRVDPKKGYVKGNIVLALNCINLFKGNQDIRRFLQIIQKLTFNKVEKAKTKVTKLYPDAVLPTLGSERASGMDIYVHRFEDHGDFYKVFSGIAIQPIDYHYYELVPRSSLYKKKLSLYNSIGIIDKDYTGEIIGILLKHEGHEPPKIGERLLQLIPRNLIIMDLIEVDSLNETKRGSGGFGSTGSR